MRRAFALTLAIVGLLASAYWLSEKPGSAQPAVGSAAKPRVAQTLRLPILSATAISTLDPIQSVEIAQYDLCNQIFEGLVKVDAYGEFAPALAVRWETSDDFKTWRFFLRDARFADDPAFPDGRGRHINADDVLYSLKRGLSPQQGSKNSFALSREVVRAIEFAEGKANEVPGLRSPQPGIIEIELKTGDRFFPTALTVPSNYVVAREAVERYGAEFGRKPVGSGPFQLARWEEGRRLVLNRNPNFGKGSGIQPKPAVLDRVEFRFFRSEAQMVTAYATGDIDVRPVVGADLAATVGADLKTALRGAHPRARIVEPGWILKLHLLAAQIGERHSFFGGSPLARRALRELLSQKLGAVEAFRGVGQIQDHILPPRFLTTPVAAPTLPDPTGELKAALSGREVRVAYASSRINDTVIRTLEEVLTDAGAKPTLFPSTSINALFGSLATVKPDLTLIYSSPYFPNASEFLTALLSNSRPVPNFTGFSSPRLDALALELRTGNRDPQRILTEVQQVLDAEMPWIPLYAETPYYLVASNVHGYTINPVSVTQLSAVRVN